MRDVILPDGSVFRFDADSSSWRHIPDVATANAMGVDWNDLDAEQQLPGAQGDDWPSVYASDGSSASGVPGGAGAPAGTLAGLPNGDVYVSDGDSWHHIPDVATFNADGYNWNNINWVGQLPGPTGDPLPSAGASAPPPPPTPTPTPPPPPAPASSFSWGGRTWSRGELGAFLGFLAAHGVDYSTWAINHPAAAEILEGPPVDPSRQPVPKSLGEALAAYIAGGSSPAFAAQQAEALRAALVAQGVSSVTPAQLLEDANVIARNYQDAQGQPPPSGEPAIEPGPVVTPVVLPSRDPGARELADARGLPPIPAGFATIKDGKVTQGFVIAAALIEHADPWLVLGTTEVESGFNLELGANSAGAVGPMQEVGYPRYSSGVDLVQWAWGNLIAGARLIANYGAVYDDDQQKISAAYNAGPGAVNAHWPGVLRWLEVAGHPEDGTVQDYVDNVATAAGDFRASFVDGWTINPATGALQASSGSHPIVTPVPVPTPAASGVNAQWQNFVSAIATESPKQRDALQSEAERFLTLFKS